MRSAVFSRARLTVPALMVAGGVLVLESAFIHLRLWQDGYRSIPVIGVLFLLQAIAGVAIGAAVIGFRRAVVALAGASYLLASIAGLMVSLQGRLFGFRETLLAPYTSLSLAVEIAGVVVLAACAALARHGGGGGSARLRLPWRHSSQRPASPGASPLLPSAGRP